MKEIKEDAQRPVHKKQKQMTHKQKPHEPKPHEPKSHEPKSHEPKPHEPKLHEPKPHGPKPHEQKKHSGKKSSSRKRRRQKQRRRQMLIERIIFVIALILFLTAAVSLIRIALEYKKGTDTYDDIFQAVVMEEVKDPEGEAQTEENQEGTPEEETVALPYVDLSSLRSINEDSAAWIYFPDTQINYPVVHGDDNAYYLKHMIDGSSNNAGTLFIEKSNRKDFADENTIIYGHNMKNGSMFGSLKKYGKSEYYKEHPSFYIYTEEGVFQYDIFSVRVVNEMSEAYTITFASDAEYNTYIDKAFRTSMYDTGVTVTSSDKIVTLSTCTSADTDRLIIQAVKGEQIR